VSKRCPTELLAQLVAEITSRIRSQGWEVDHVMIAVRHGHVDVATNGPKSSKPQFVQGVVEALSTTPVISRKGSS